MEGERTTQRSGTTRQQRSALVMRDVGGDVMVGVRQDLNGGGHDANVKSLHVKSDEACLADWAGRAEHARGLQEVSPIGPPSPIVKREGGGKPVRCGSGITRRMVPFNVWNDKHSPCR
jgi:hypothetical protein